VAGAALIRNPAHFARYRSDPTRKEFPMRLFKCQSCGQLLYFENTKCERCQHVLGYAPEQATLLALEPGEQTPAGQIWTEPSASWRFCANAEYGVCNWLIPAGSSEKFCTACRHNHIVPDLNDAENRLRWCHLEGAKHRLFYTLLKLRLPLATRAEDPVHGLAFDFLAETPAQPKVLTGHDDGLITIALKEGDHAERERMREQMGELYRTPLGHFRHEIGHHYWDLLVRDSPRLEACRAMFGDERADYEQALKDHYGRVHKPGWQQYFVSLYATSHPWEDFAETWAHYLHILDTLEMAGAFGIGVHPKLTREPGLQADIDFDPHRQQDFTTIIDAWLPLAFAVNSLNRSMGQNDLYPFVLSPKVVEKLGFIHDLVRQPS
jgi:hypothetical protein